MNKENGSGLYEAIWVHTYAMTESSGSKLVAFAYKAHLSSIRLLIVPVEHLAGSLACARACR